MVIMSAVVATGMIRDNVAVIIGAMVIAPLLGPNVALSLATTLGDGKLAQRAALVNLWGLGTAVVFSIIVGYVLSFQTNLLSTEVFARTQVNLSDIGLALASGIAGALSFTTGAPAAVIGVMVAVALMPPLVALGMLLGAGLWAYAYGALLLLITNIICINLAGVGTFLVQGFRPTTWHAVERAKRATMTAVGIWLALLMVLVMTLMVARPPDSRETLSDAAETGLVKLHRTIIGPTAGLGRWTTADASSAMQQAGMGRQRPNRWELA
jgi:uncharacterized hydrophobic protein (TIGR00341 family)